MSRQNIIIVGFLFLSIQLSANLNSKITKKTDINSGIKSADFSPYAKLKSVDLESVHWTDGFWADKFNIASEVSLPRLWELAGPYAWHNMRVEAGLEKGDVIGVDWQDEWIYKWIESACYVYAQNHDKELISKMDTIISVIKKAQSNDGYIATQITLRGKNRFTDYKNHEVYTMGHLITAACVHYRITGKSNFLTLAKKTADYLYNEYKSMNNPYLINCPLNPSIIMATVELYRTTGDKKYLELANIIIDNRGKERQSVPIGKNGQTLGNTDLNQDRVPLRKEVEVVGHSVFWSYLFSGAADTFMETGDKTILDALQRLWTDLVDHKMYITGGVSALHSGISSRFDKERNIRRYGFDEVHEAVGLPYELPNSRAYNETCGQVGNLMWNWRMLLITGEARFADIMEQTIYNSIMAGVNVSGEGWSYSNPLSWHGANHDLMSSDSHTRCDPGKGLICCPTNVLRLIASWNGYLYSTEKGKLWIHQYGANEATIEIPEIGSIKLVEETKYPWDGKIKITLKEVKSNKPFALKLRIPGWANEVSLKINKSEINQTFEPTSYTEILRQWKNGDVIELNLPMKPKLMASNSLVEVNRNQVAVMNGPIVYCQESVDLPTGININQVHILRETSLGVEYKPSLLGGVNILKVNAVVQENNSPKSSQLYFELKQNDKQKLEVQLIPYFAWNNRGEPEMNVWLPLW